MGKKEPKLMDAAMMKDLLSHHHIPNASDFFMNNEIGVLNGNPELFQSYIFQQAPFVINDYRMGIIVQGEGLININLVERQLNKGMIVFLSPSTIINPVHFSEDYEVMGMALFPDFMMPFSSVQTPIVFKGQVRDFAIPVSDIDFQIAQRLLNTIWFLVNQPDYQRPVVSSLVAALAHHYSAAYTISMEQRKANRSQEQTIFDRFIQLVNQHCVNHHHIAYYADRICLTERYLNSIVRHTSGVTAKEWIDRALIMRVKVELIHTDKPIAQIAEDMNFPNSSFFCKYFKRIVGVTPKDYRLKGGIM